MDDRERAQSFWSAWLRRDDETKITDVLAAEFAAIRAPLEARIATLAADNDRLRAECTELKKRLADAGLE